MRITAPVSLRREPHRALVNDFMVRFPQLEVTLNLTNQLLDLVHEGYDLAIRLGHLRDSTLVALAGAAGALCVRLAGLHRPSRHAQQPLGAGPSHLSGGQRGRVALHPER